MHKKKINAWISAFRLRTLPLALSSVGMGSFLAAFQKSFDWEVFILAALTIIFLQILSNLANDYGDSIHGADSITRQGPQRAVQSGEISAQSMKTALWIFIGLCLVSGIALIIVALGINITLLIGFFILGLIAIWAAIAYTNGKKPYGYAGMGDLFVLIFFGFVGVIGTFYLHAAYFDWQIILPAISCGLLATAVLNVNNVRDIQSDEQAGKKTIPVRIGKNDAAKYHWTLLILSILTAITYILLNLQSYFQFLFIVTIPLIIKNGYAVNKFDKPSLLDPFLKQMAIATFLFVVTYGIGLLLSGFATI